MVRHLSRTLKAPGSIPNTTKVNKTIFSLWILEHRSGWLVFTDLPLTLLWSLGDGWAIEVGMDLSQKDTFSLFFTVGP